MGVILLLAMLVLLLVGIHMIVRPQGYVGRGPIPARDASNVRAMGFVFAFLGGGVTFLFTAPVFLSSLFV
ncbi:MAG: hypothetical protein J0J06_01105 [Sphingomonas sp.]|uniref:hypothetical protein n=1 Tax=Sphingomonas sp. TaxID=28214 RepID=UPI001ACBC425|nr:hypothetical protein [Sphingomonas sp.]MBN8814026.1 hypothetical protein [Sphingomonas sp.]